MGLLYNVNGLPVLMQNLIIKKATKKKKPQKNPKNQKKNQNVWVICHHINGYVGNGVIVANIIPSIPVDTHTCMYIHVYKQVP